MTQFPVLCCGLRCQDHSDICDDLFPTEVDTCRDAHKDMHYELTPGSSAVTENWLHKQFGNKKLVGAWLSFHCQGPTGSISLLPELCFLQDGFQDSQKQPKLCSSESRLFRCFASQNVRTRCESCVNVTRACTKRSTILND